MLRSVGGSVWFTWLLVQTYRRTVALHVLCTRTVRVDSMGSTAGRRHSCARRQQWPIMAKQRQQGPVSAVVSRRRCPGAHPPPRGEMPQGGPPAVVLPSVGRSACRPVGVVGVVSRAARCVHESTCFMGLNHGAVARWVCAGCKAFGSKGRETCSCYHF